MATICIYDADFFTYKRVIPNLECMKLCAYFRRRGDVTVLAPKMEPDHYTRTYYRKDYDDGIYPEELLRDDIIYGGAAFSNNIYVPMNEGIEKCAPDISSYSDKVNYFARTESDKKLFKTIINAEHCRLSLDEEKLTAPVINQILTSKKRVLIIHDFNIASIVDSEKLIKEFQLHAIKTGKGWTPSIGMKFPISIKSETDFKRWSFLNPNYNLFNFKYQGVINDELLFNLINENGKLLERMEYEPLLTGFDENQILMEQLPRIFAQVLFLRRRGYKIPLIFDSNLVLNEDLKTILFLIKRYASYSWQEKPQSKNNLFTMAKTMIANHEIGKEITERAFIYLRIHNYDLFRQFYECQDVKFEKGEFIPYEQLRDSRLCR